MRFKRILLITLLFFGIFYSIRAEIPKVNFYAEKEITFCKGCFGHFGVDGWKFKFRLENLSGKDIVIYGQRFGTSDEEFRFIKEIQYRNPDICEWQYSYGESKKRCDWDCLPSSYKHKIILKAGESIEADGGIIDGSNVPQCYTAYIAGNLDEEPYEIFSEPFELVKVLDEKGITTNTILKKADEECNPSCKIPIEQSPEIQGIKLGMTLKDFKTKFPKLEISSLHQDKYNYKVGYLWNWNEDAFNVTINFLEDKVARIKVQFRSLKNTRHREDFYKLVSDTIHFSHYWKPYQSGWECKDFLIDVLPNETPTITLVSKDFIKVQQILAEDDLKNYK